MGVSCKKAEKCIVLYINKSRRKRGISSCKSDYGLKKLARSHSKHMAKSGKIWHGKGVHLVGGQLFYEGFWGFITSLFYKGTSGENVAMIDGRKFSSKSLAKKFHKMWMHSPGHKRNILNSDFSAVGVGIKNGRRGYFATEIFYG